MALVTTLLTTPILNWVYPRSWMSKRPAQTHPHKPAFTVSDSRRPSEKAAGPLVQLADTIIGSPDNPGKILGAASCASQRITPTYRSGLDEAEVSYDGSLAPLLAQARCGARPTRRTAIICEPRHRQRHQRRRQNHTRWISC